MSRFTRKIRISFLKGMEVLGTTAASLASNAKHKVNEINLETRRREILTNFSLQAFELWQKGVTLPDPLSEMLTELSDIEGRLSVLRAQKYAKVSDQATQKNSITKQETQTSPEDSIPEKSNEETSPYFAEELAAFPAATSISSEEAAVIEEEETDPSIVAEDSDENNNI